MPRILVAEDEPLHAHLLAVFLGREGLPFELVRDGLSLLERLDRRVYDLLLLDLRLPKLGGLEAVAWLRGRPGPRPRLVAITSDDDPLLGAQCREAGFDAFFVKPFDLGALRAEIALAAGRPRA